MSISYFPGKGIYHSPLHSAIHSSVSAIFANNLRSRVVAENISHANMVAPAAGEEPYRRKTVNFADVYDKATGLSSVKVASVGRDDSPMPVKYDPSHPAADKDGMIKKSNVELVFELMDLRESMQAHEANMSALKAAFSMVNRTVDAIGGN